MHPGRTQAEHNGRRKAESRGHRRTRGDGVREVERWTEGRREGQNMETDERRGGQRSTEREGSGEK